MRVDLNSRLYSRPTFAKKNLADEKKAIEEPNPNKNFSKFIVGAGALFIAGLGVKALVSRKTSAVASSMHEEVSTYSKGLAESLGKYLDKKVEARNLKSVISGEELLNELKNLKKENFVATKENIEKGIFTADLHSHTVYSDGKGKVEDILNQVAEYADALYQKNGKKFIFALTDHDAIGGVKEALKLISENPEKYKNVKFVTGSEMSFLIKADKNGRPFETSEMLVYGFNPFEKNVNEYFDNLYARRKNMVKNYIEDLNKMFEYADFSVEEFNNTYGKNYVMNNTWKVHHYGQTKNAISGLAISQGKDKNVMYKEIMSQTEQFKKTLHDLRTAGLVPKDYGDDTRITDMCLKKYNPNWKDGKIDYATEANIVDIVSVFGKEKGTFGAFAHPYYITERNSNAEELINDILFKTDGFIKATESHHQAYKPRVDMKRTEELNKFISSKYGILELGGRDNHNPNWLNK